MKNTQREAVSQLPTSAVGPSDGCSLELSVDGKWMRLIVAGRLSAAFNVEYVRKVLGDAPKESQKRSKREPEVPANI